jgi:phytoene desaturase
MDVDGYSFDMGPSWYWMPDVFEAFFQRYGKSVADYYELVRLNPSYRVFFEHGKIIDVPSDFQALKQLFESIESGAGSKLEAFMEEAKTKYTVSMSDFVWKPSLSIKEFMDWRIIREATRLDLFTSFSKHVRKYFQHPQLIQLIEFPVLFLGAKPSKTPAMYSMMNYADMVLGTWYPKGGMRKIPEAMASLAKELGVHIHVNAAVEELCSDGSAFDVDAVVAAADYRHVEEKLLRHEDRDYTDKYWEKRVMSPSSLIFYLGVEGRTKNLLHHNLFFDHNFDQHAATIYDHPDWPTSPLFYVCCTSQTDGHVAPENHENLFILIPVAPGLKSDESLRERYLQDCLKRIHAYTGEDLTGRVRFKKSYAHEEFIHDYNAFKGNAYGLANTLKQTAILKPRMRSQKVENLFFAGQLTVPGPGVPPSLISGCIASEELNKYLKN